MTAFIHSFNQHTRVNQPRFGYNDSVPEKLSEDKPLVIMESPFAGKTPEEFQKNIEYGYLALRDCLMRGEAPMASHMLYGLGGVTDDDIDEERNMGIDAGLAWHKVSDKTVVYTDRGMSKGMEFGIQVAKDAGKPVEMRTIPGYKLDETA